MSEMIERVARTLCADENWREIVAPDKLPEYVDAHWRSCIPIARAAIEAMRDPTDLMVKAVFDPYDGPGRGDIEYVWSGMIDAILATADQREVAATGREADPG